MDREHIGHIARYRQLGQEMKPGADGADRSCVPAAMMSMTVQRTEDRALSE